MQHPTDAQGPKPPARIPSLVALSDDELKARRDVLAEQLCPLWQQFDAVEDEINARRRERRRQRILAPCASLEESESHATTEAV